MNAWLLTQLARDRHVRIRQDAHERRLAQLAQPPRHLRAQLGRAVIALAQTLLALGRRLAENEPSFENEAL